MDCMVVVGVVVLAMLQSAAAQTTYLVGDSLGWAIPQNGAATYTTWASGKTFMVGDILTFNFATNAHNVQQVPKESFDACTSANPIGNATTTGPANITLTTTGDQYYICTIGSHCQARQKLAITVSGTPGAAPPTTTTPPPPLATPPPTTNTPTACPPTSPSAPPAYIPGKEDTLSRIAPHPDSSSSAVLASFYLTFLSFAICFSI